MHVSTMLHWSPPPRSLDNVKYCLSLWVEFADIQKAYIYASSYSLTHGELKNHCIVSIVPTVGMSHVFVYDEVLE